MTVSPVGEGQWTLGAREPFDSHVSKDQQRSKKKTQVHTSVTPGSPDPLGTPKALTPIETWSLDVLGHQHASSKL